MWIEAWFTSKFDHRFRSINLIAFRVGAEDAAFLAREFQPTFGATDLINLPNHDTYLKLMIDGAPPRPFSATSLHPDDFLGSANRRVA